MTRSEVLDGPERRRRWSEDEKTAIWPGPGSADTQLSYPYLRLEGSRTDAAERRVASARIVDKLNIVEHVAPLVDARPVDFAPDGAPRESKLFDVCSFQATAIDGCMTRSAASA